MKTSSLLLILLLAACTSREPALDAPVEAFRAYSGDQKWYWSSIQGLRGAPAGFTASHDFFQKRPQVILISTNEETSIVYTELAPSDGLKSFRGSRDFDKIEGIELPLFSSRYEKPTFIGFFGGRAFRITVQNATNVDEARKTALNLGLEVLRSNLAVSTNAEEKDRPGR